MLGRIPPLLLIIALLAHASAAHAQSTPDTEEVTVEHTYGSQILLADLVGVTLMGVGAMSDTWSIVGTGMAVSTLAPMAIHAANGNGKGAVVSVLMRPALVFVGGMIGFASAASCYEGEWFCGVGEAVIGGAAGYATAAVLDALLARVDRTERRPQWAPHVAVTSGGMRVGIGGTF